MNLLLTALTLVLLLSMLAGLGRVVMGPTTADRMMASLLFGTAGVAILMLLAEVAAMPSLKDVALVFVVLAAVAIVAFVRLIWSRRPKNGR